MLQKGAELEGCGGSLEGREIEGTESAASRGMNQRRSEGYPPNYGLHCRTIEVLYLDLDRATVVHTVDLQSEEVGVDGSIV